MSVPSSACIATILSGHGKIRSYFYRFKIVSDQNCVCGYREQTVQHLVNYCPLLDKERNCLKAEVCARERMWPITNYELISNYLKLFTTFIENINFSILVDTDST